MNKTVTKRNGDIVEFDALKIMQAIANSNNETNEMSPTEIKGISKKVDSHIDDNNIHVEDIQDLVEEFLMLEKFTKTAKAYILYREKQAEGRKRDIFQPRKNLKPYEYPELEKYVTAIRSSYWIHTEYNYTSDIQNFKIDVESHERTAIKNSMLAISQVEIDVKQFWANLYSRLPKPELSSVGATFAESEVRHSDAYSHLLELLGLNSEFENIENIPALNNRVEYLKKHNHYANTGSDRDYTIAILLFSAFVEHISLFSQFLIIMSFNKHKNLFSGVSNVIEATSKEENLHGQFGIDLINVIKEENPEWFDESMENDIYKMVEEAYESELEVLDWIFEDGDLDFLPRYTVEEFIKSRLNNSLDRIGMKEIFEVDEREVMKTDWFNEELIATKHLDFFSKRNVNYTKRSRSITLDDLF